MHNNMSAAQQRSLELAQDPYWRNQKPVSRQQKRRLETSWDDRHQFSFASQLNSLMQKNMRDYFDRPRELPIDSLAGVKPKACWRPTWSLTSGYKIADRPFSMARSSELDMEPLSVARRGGWDGRHHITHSQANHLFHDNDREYFGLFLNKRSERVLQPRTRGLTYHYKPLMVRGNPDGADEGPTNSELLMQHGMPLSRRPQGGPLSLTAGSGQMRESSASLGSQVPGRPDASFDNFGDD